MITTIIPTYKRPIQLLKAIKTAQDQKIEGAQILVLDNCSGDSTREVVLAEASKDARIKYICHEKNIGPFENFRFGYLQTQTPYLNFLSDDDLLFNGFYKKALETLAQYPEAALFACSTISINDDQNVFWVTLKNRKDVEFYTGEKAVREYTVGDFPAWTSVVFRKEFCEKVGGLGNGILFDEELILKLVIRFPYLLSKQRGAIYHSSVNCFSRSINNYALFEERERLISEIGSYKEVEFNSKNIMTGYLRSVNRQMSLIYFIKSLYAKDFEFAEKFLLNIDSTRAKSFILNLLLGGCKNSALFHKFFFVACWIRIKIKKIYRDSFYAKYTDLCRKLKVGL